MSLNKFTNTTIKPWMNIGVNDLECKTLKVNGEDVGAESTANATLRFDGEPYVLTITVPGAVSPASLHRTRYGGYPRGRMEFVNVISHLWGIKVNQDGYYRVTGMLSYTLSVPIARLELSPRFEGGTLQYPILTRGVDEGVADTGGTMNFTGDLIVLANGILELGVTASAQESITVTRWELSVEMLSPIDPANTDEGTPS